MKMLNRARGQFSIEDAAATFALNNVAGHIGCVGPATNATTTDTKIPRRYIKHKKIFE